MKLLRENNEWKNAHLSRDEYEDLTGRTFSFHLYEGERPNNFLIEISSDDGNSEDYFLRGKLQPYDIGKTIADFLADRYDWK